MDEHCQPTVDARADEIFRSTNGGDYALDCCASLTQQNRRTLAVNRQGLVFELLQDDNITQEFYETTCSAAPSICLKSEQNRTV